MGWTWRDNAFAAFSDEETEAEIEKREPVVKMVAERLANLRRDRERRGFDRQAREDEGHFDELEFESDAEAASFRLRRETEDNLEYATERALEEQLHGLGARMMRPYEHHNEDERLMEYLERDRD